MLTVLQATLLVCGHVHLLKSSLVWPYSFLPFIMHSSNSCLDHPGGFETGCHVIFGGLWFPMHP